MTPANDGMVPVDRLRVAVVAWMVLAGVARAADLPPAIAAPGETTVLQVHAVGAQIYQCKPDPDGHLSWQFREPIATLVQDGKTVGRHFAGPSWQVGDSIIVGKAVGHAPGNGPNDAAWLKLEVTERHGAGPLAEVTTVQRINTAGGNVQGACETEGALRPEPYAADYVFLKKAP
jgi:hypothetical protein